MRELICRLSHNAPIGGPTGELGAIRKLKLSQHRAHVRFDRLDRNEQFGRHLFIRVTTRDQPHDLLLAGGQPVQLLIMSPCRTISAATLAAWPRALELARTFWQVAAADGRISASFQAIARQNLQSLGAG